MDLYARLKLQRKEDGTFPAEYMHFPSGMGDEYYKQLTGEVCKLEEDGRGHPKMVWEKQYDAVETLDCAVYTLALYKICGFHLWAEERWGGGQDAFSST
jgi:phage terminase large subunit GpA-like protein